MKNNEHIDDHHSMMNGPRIAQSLPKEYLENILKLSDEYERQKKTVPETPLARKKQIAAYLERARQDQFAEEQSKESVFTRPNESIVDCDN